ncbi:hypothetical protein [Wolbachia endosymbiont (group A) of Beris morrisii]|uniref:hypothetical protein n=1 Tax=Wolbachia endosymbiont (group A) of Beris morrisii TaxID=3066139 RepID=UPI003341ABCB
MCTIQHFRSKAGFQTGMTAVLRHATANRHPTTNRHTAAVSLSIDPANKQRDDGCRLAINV